MLKNGQLYFKTLAVLTIHGQARVSKILQNSQENTCVRVSILIKACNFINIDILIQVLSCQFREISRNTFFYRTPVSAASGISYFSAVYFLSLRPTRTFTLDPFFGTRQRLKAVNYCRKKLTPRYLKRTEIRL